MKVCVECNFHKRAPVEVPGRGTMMVDVCLHEECRDPVDGAQIPCAAARRELLFCGGQGRYHQPKPIEPEKKVIQIAKE